MPDPATTDAYFLIALQIHHPTTASNTQGSGAMQGTDSAIIPTILSGTQILLPY